MMELMTLKLDSAYKPVGIVSWRDALVLVISEKAYAVELYETYVRSARQIFQLPSVIALKRFVNVDFLRPVCSRKNIILRDENICQYCAQEFATDDLTMDHIVPRAQGGEKSWKNIVASCKPCNQKKGNRTPEQAGMKLLKEPKPLTGPGMLKRRSDNLQEDWKNYLDIYSPIH
jgi:5-methylcytosine-specific restriction endonuclease McrA